ncbi:penicillin acylase family protein [Aureimonas mangrovi]|uniref:penicillin acylase family protein n=1 Tax=Aureimonas mangrovi TaxID=2758041 RepID=UPI00163D7BE3|nr:penicillin acylase family protein [Aureimonas mangrovi]
MTEMLRSQEMRRLKELVADVEIAVDRFGVSHIRAQNRDDLFFAQGWNVARDRLWQIDLWRKRGLGLLAADLGPGYLAQDRASRLFLYRGEMAPEWRAYAPDAEEICEAFVAGINAYVESTQCGEAALPREFELMGTRPAKWAASDVVRIRSHALTRNALSEVLRSNVLGRAGEEAERLRRSLEPAVDLSEELATGVGPVPLAVADVFKLGTAGVSFSRERLDARLEDAERWAVVDPIGKVIARAEAEGSNNWAVSGSRTGSGRPILAMDPHRAHAVPSLRYVVHLSMPGFDVIGAGEPAVPGITFGHNGHSAFAITISGADQEDVYVYDTAEGDSASYRYGEGFEAMEVVRESFEVKGHDAVTQELRFTRHGPVLLEDKAAKRAYALRTVWSQPGSAPYMASLSVMRARSVESWREALTGWGTPATNHVYADASGTIGWQVVGKTPIRPNWSGLLPVAGDGRHEWAGHVDPLDLPHVVDPERGFIATANEMNIAAEWLATNPPIGFEWIEASRSRRIHEVLDTQDRHTFEDSRKLQTDVLSLVARRAKAAIAAMALEEGARPAAELLADWDGRLEADSAPAALFELWFTRHLKPALFARATHDTALQAIMLPGDVDGVMDALDGEEQQVAVLVSRTLAAAWADIAARLGPDPAGWRWGDLHRLTLDHPLAGVAPEAAGELSVPSMPLGGSGSTPMCAVYRPSDFEITVGASVRMIVDVGAWDESVFINMPGQSGDPASTHYRDLAPVWLEGHHHPLAYSLEAVDAVTASTIVLSPDG